MTHQERLHFWQFQTFYHLAKFRFFFLYFGPFKIFSSFDHPRIQSQSQSQSLNDSWILYSGLFKAFCILDSSRSLTPWIISEFLCSGPFQNLNTRNQSKITHFHNFNILDHSRIIVFFWQFLKFKVLDPSKKLLFLTIS